MTAPARINRVVVIGAGTMGAAIAAHVANARIPVRLLDVDAKLVAAGFERLRRATPPALFTPATADLITTGTLTEDFAAVGEADWIVEAIVENLDAKRDLMARIDGVRRPDSIVSSNTSGLPIAAIAEGTSRGFRQRFLGTHFFNPPRYLKLLEVIPTADTLPAVTGAMREFGERRLGKGVALCKDTPNFIGNRYASVTGALLLGYILDNGYTVEEVDTILGPLVGHPKTAVFRLYDLVGIDVAAFVSRNLYALIPHDESREALGHPRVGTLFGALLERKSLGDKTGHGFYRKTKSAGGETQIDVLDLETLEYRPRREPEIPSLAAASRIKRLPERLAFLLAQGDRAGALVRHTTYQALGYAARRIPEIADDVLTFDNVVRWGFAHELGPFETWDALGVRATADALKKHEIAVAGWVEELLGKGHAAFYRGDANGRVHYDVARGDYEPERQDPRRLVLASVKGAKGVVVGNAGGSLIDLGDGVACLEFHTKLNTLDDQIEEMVCLAVDQVERQWDALVVGNDGADFCVGANLARLGMAIGMRAFDIVDRAVAAMQNVMQRMRFSTRPVVVAPFNRTLGGGAEVCLAGARIVAAAETYIGLVEVGVGLIPAAGGCKEMVRRLVSPQMQVPHVDPHPFLKQVVQMLGTAKVSASAADARAMGFLSHADRIVMNRDHLIAEAKAVALALADDYMPPPRAKVCYAAGRDACAALLAELHILQRAGFASEYDRHVVGKLAHVLCGGDISSGQWVDEQWILDLEREAFVSLCGEAKTLERMQHLLKTGKPLRN
jgi:3-hydroxyacyl-CoA dehydrogenase